MGIQYLTLYAFSTENWKRAASEVGFIMGLVKQYLRDEMAFYRENHIRIRHAGNAEDLPRDIAAEIAGAQEDTKDFKGMQVILAINYGGRDEIVRAMRRVIADRFTGAHPAGGQTAITEEDISGGLDNPDVPDPDLIIRSAGEYRMSNFLLWQGAYSELYISPKFWPDWIGKDLEEAVGEYSSRDRRYGGVNAMRDKPQ
jgi:undecaprenyl diphosphate synthase